MYLLDTDTLIYSLKGNKTVIENLKLHANDPKSISVISYGELIFGAQKSDRYQENLAKVHRLKEIFPVIDITPSIMETFGLLKANLQKTGSSVDDFDLIIGSTCIANGYTIVTNNEKHFNKIPGVKVVNWTKKPT